MYKLIESDASELKLKEQFENELRMLMEKESAVENGGGAPKIEETKTDEVKQRNLLIL